MKTRLAFNQNRALSSISLLFRSGIGDTPWWKMSPEHFSGSAGLQPSSSHSACAGKYFTLIELLIVISIIMILASLLLPALHQAKAKADSASCQSKLKQWGLALVMYAEDYGGITPKGFGPAGNLSTISAPYLLYPYLKINPAAMPSEFSTPMLICPSEQKVQDSLIQGATVSCFGTNYFMGNRKIGTISLPSRRAYMFDFYRGWLGAYFNLYEYKIYGSWRHNDAGNYVFMDGHAALKKRIVVGCPANWVGPLGVWSDDYNAFYE